MVLTAEVSQLIDECFEGRRVRDCANCPADRFRGGTCCFGDPEEHDPSTQACQECLHFHECQEEVKDARGVYQRPRQTIPVNKPSRFTARQQERLVQIGGARKSVPPSRGTAPQPTRQGPPSVYTPPQPLVVPEGHEDSLFNRWCKDTVWGAFQGASEASVWFFQNHYWQ